MKLARSKLHNLRETLATPLKEGSTATLSEPELIKMLDQITEPYWAPSLKMRKKRGKGAIKEDEDIQPPGEEPPSPMFLSGPPMKSAKEAPGTGKAFSDYLAQRSYVTEGEATGDAQLCTC